MKDFYIDKIVLVTGHKGFKGTWLCKILVMLGAKVIGYGLDNGVEPSLFQLSEVEKDIVSIDGDVRDLPHMKEVFEMYKPQMVFHLAAQPIVLEGYKNPVYTYHTNVMGTVHVMECVRLSQSVKSVINVTTDKVYENLEEHRAFVEEDRLNGIDPYSNSKSCSELVTDAYIRSFFEKSDRELAVSTVRAGNVLGGGDFSQNRIIPDCVRAALLHEDIEIRNPNSVRPYQHVLEALYVYLMLGQKQWENGAYAGHYNVGPDEADCATSSEIATMFCDAWGEGISWYTDAKPGPREAGFLELNCDKLRRTFGWNPNWDIRQTLNKTVEWYKVYERGGSIPRAMENQIEEFFHDIKTGLK